MEYSNLECTYTSCKCTSEILTMYGNIYIFHPATLASLPSSLMRLRLRMISCFVSRAVTRILKNQPAVQDELSCSVDHVHIPSRVSSEATIPLSTTVSSMKLRNHDLKLNLGALALGVGSYHFQPSGVSSQRCAQCTSNPAVPYSLRMRHKRL